MITLKVTVLRTLRDKSVGLIGRQIEPVYFTTRWGIHTFGVQRPIDVLILDGNNRVMKLAQSLPPNRIFFWNPVYDKVIELPAGEIGKYNISVGDTIALKSKIPAIRSVGR